MLPHKLAVGAAVVLSGLLLPLRLSVPAAPPPKASPCTQGENVYARLRAGQTPGAFAREYEIRLGATVYGPVTGLKVPWAAVDRWAATHGEAGVGFCDPSGGYTLVGLSVRKGWAYVLVGPAGQVEKIYLSDHPLTWD